MCTRALNHKLVDKQSQLRSEHPSFSVWDWILTVTINCELNFINKQRQKVPNYRIRHVEDQIAQLSSNTPTWQDQGIAMVACTRNNSLEHSNATYKMTINITQAVFVMRPSMHIIIFDRAIIHWLKYVWKYAIYRESQRHLVHYVGSLQSRNFLMAIKTWNFHPTNIIHIQIFVFKFLTSCIFIATLEKERISIEIENWLTAPKTQISIVPYAFNLIELKSCGDFHK